MKDELGAEYLPNKQSVHKAVDFGVSSCELDNPVAIFVAMALPYPARSKVLVDCDQLDVNWQHGITH